jgi:hypothetical protein
MALDEAKARLQELMTELQAQRDELQVRMHLGAAEAKEEWTKLEEKLYQLQVKADAMKGPAGEVLDDVSAKAKELGEEIKQGYAKLKTLFTA